MESKKYDNGEQGAMACIIWLNHDSFTCWHANNVLVGLIHRAIALSVLTVPVKHCYKRSFPPYFLGTSIYLMMPVSVG